MAQDSQGHAGVRGVQEGHAVARGVRVLEEWGRRGATSREIEAVRLLGEATRTLEAEARADLLRLAARQLELEAQALEEPGARPPRPRLSSFGLEYGRRAGPAGEA